MTTAIAPTQVLHVPAQRKVSTRNTGLAPVRARSAPSRAEEAARLINGQVAVLAGDLARRRVESAQTLTATDLVVSAIRAFGGVGDAGAGAIAQPSLPEAPRGTAVLVSRNEHPELFDHLLSRLNRRDGPRAASRGSMLVWAEEVDRYRTLLDNTAAALAAEPNSFLKATVALTARVLHARLSEQEPLPAGIAAPRFEIVGRNDVGLTLAAAGGSQVTLPLRRQELCFIPGVGLDRFSELARLASMPNSFFLTAEPFVAKVMAYGAQHLVGARNISVSESATEEALPGAGSVGAVILSGLEGLTGERIGEVVRYASTSLAAGGTMLVLLPPRGSAPEGSVDSAAVKDLLTANGLAVSTVQPLFRRGGTQGYPPSEMSTRSEVFEDPASTAATAAAEAITATRAA